MQDFQVGIRELKELVGSNLEGRVTVDQVYARYQDGWGDVNDSDEWNGVITPTEESQGPAGKPGPTFNHPFGGEAGYLSGQLTGKGPEIASGWADAVLEGRLSEQMISDTQGIADDVYTLAPRETWILAGSAAASVKEGGAQIYDHPSLVPRMTQAELDAVRDAETGDLNGTEGELGGQLQAESSMYGGALSHDLRRRRLSGLG